MKKIFFRFLTFLFLLILISITYLSTIGIKTNKFNSRISEQVKKIDKNLEINLNKVKIILNPLKLKISAKTLGTDLIYKDKSIQLENIKSNISLKSFIKGNFLLTGLSISTKSLEIKNLVSFIRLIERDPKIYIAEQFIENGYIIADIEIEFDELGNIKDNYNIKGLVKDGNINLLKRFDLSGIDFIYYIKKNNFLFTDLKLSLNKKNISIPKITVEKNKDKFLLTGKVNNKNTILYKKDLSFLIEESKIGSDIEEINFNSENNFSFNLDKKFKISDLKIVSKIDLKNLKLKNSLKLEKIFPKIKNEILLQNHKIKIDFNNNNLTMTGSGDALFQGDNDKLKYEIIKKKDEIVYKTNLTISKNSFYLDVLDYKKSKNSNLEIAVLAKKKIKNDLLIQDVTLKENNNIISFRNLSLSNNYKINNVEKVTLKYFDNENFENKIQINKIDKNYLIKGNSFNINKIVTNILDSNKKKKLSIFNNDFKLNFDIKKIYLDTNHSMDNLKGYLFLKNNVISELNLESKFSNKKNIKLTIKTNGEEKITTLFSSEAKPLVDRYKFIKGFEEGNLDFYSINKGGTSNSTLKIDNFKIQEIPALAKLLTLASLQGIADLLTGEGIRFTDFEMKFSSKDELMTIKEIYAIGPAISILMEGYIEENKLISLRGTLVPATTVNRTISSIPIIGDILVGKKVGEGVFGVSFKIKGPPKDLETTVNPIKTLTPRFITRTLEKIKKN
tara:strand:- start:498 stop:2690 length:2193 start_codon:yes stop_codon:yes gene_type:complete